MTKTNNFAFKTAIVFECMQGQNWHVLRYIIVYTLDKQTRGGGPCRDGWGVWPGRWRASGDTPSSALEAGAASRRSASSTIAPTRTCRHLQNQEGERVPHRPEAQNVEIWTLEEEDGVHLCVRVCGDGVNLCVHRWGFSSQALPPCCCLWAGLVGFVGTAGRFNSTLLGPWTATGTKGNEAKTLVYT